ncbi:aminotransferase class V-fold PLP-dependent enzyme (plasmid) [Pseudorhodobacter turbinis]|uniref:Aminotransferase class V-fold PLP-dependent enzyme n=1 Tax=Pseudorhodobacter turbinis TaxID=2500533 RepID=A0A4P8EK57_9RHOB|nr:aminotransferase class V-fold PLP-dependent enzyme [Pseudorhodobacter turbinis]QCO57388.1 aminotransferase class V-fold PLP-dependent enzyme [Pseudorhodobacter turbinis]
MIEDQTGLLDEIRSRFAHVATCPVQGDRIFFENGGGSLTLSSVVETSVRMAAIPDNQGRDNPASKELMRQIAAAKAKAHAFFNAKSGQVFVGESGTELLFRLLSVACLGAEKPGVVLGSTLEHPASRSAAVRWAGIAGLKEVVVAHNDATGTVTADDYLSAITPDVKVATIIHTSPVTGMGVDIAAIAQAIRKVAPDCFIIVDGIQHAAHGGIDVDAADIDGYVISPYKVFSRHGYGLAWISDRLAALPHNALIGGPEQNWEMGTRDTGSYATFSDVVDYFDWLGSRFTDSSDLRIKIEAAGRAMKAHEASLIDAMMHGTGNQKGLAELDGVSVIGGHKNSAREGLVCLAVAGMDSVEVVKRLNDQGIRTHVRKADHYSGNILRPLGMESAVRVSLAHYNSREEVARFLAVMRGIAEG